MPNAGKCEAMPRLVIVVRAQPSTRPSTRPSTWPNKGIGKGPRAVTSNIVEYMLFTDLTWEVTASKDERVSFLEAAVEKFGSKDVVNEWPNEPRM